MKKKCIRCGIEFELKNSRQKYCGEMKIAVCCVCGKEFQYKCEKDVVTDRCPECVEKKLFLRTCKVCGKQFISSASKQICNGAHYKTCPVCGKQFIAPNARLYEDLCCSDECTKQRRNQHIKDAAKIKPPGWNQSKTVYRKICKYCGKEFETNQPQKLYCNDSHYATCEICERQFEISIEQIQRGTRVCSEECRDLLAVKSVINDSEKFQEWQRFISNPEKWIQAHFDTQPTYLQLSSALGMAIPTIQQRLKAVGKEDLVKHYVSTMEQEVIDFIRSLDENIEIIHNDREAIKPNEIDIYLHQYKLGIECNPTITHNSSISTWSDNFPGVSPNYHKRKSQMAEDNGIFLFHLFSYEWIHKNEIMKSMIRNLLGKNDHRIYARKCKVLEISNTECKQFLEANHRQGYVATKINLGLKQDDDLVSIMTFSPSRNTIGKKSDAWELVRFCSKLNTSVIGAASKLFKHFVEAYQVKQIISFSDIARTRGNLYETLGFHLDHISEPGYVWVDAGDIAYSRVNAQKSNICKFLHDDSIDLSKSEFEIMESHGYKRVHDCGTKVWIYDVLEILNRYSK